MIKKSNKTKNRLALKEWADKVHAMYYNKCAICGKPSKDPHHIISKHVRATRYDINNGIALCKYHHRLAKIDPSAHGNPILFYEWMRINCPRQYTYILARLDALRPGQSIQCKKS